MMFFGPSMLSHFCFDKARRLHATSEIPNNKRTKLSNNMKKNMMLLMLLYLYCQAKKTHQKISKQIKLKWKDNKNAFNKEYTILKVRKRKINMNVVKDVNNSVQKLKVQNQVESKLNYANNAFNMELY